MAKKATNQTTKGRPARQSEVSADTDGGSASLTFSPPEAETADIFPIVALGASAGGLEALESFFSNMPADPGLSFVVIQHLSPGTRSVMRQLLQAKTKMAVHLVENGIKIEPNKIYVNPPGMEVSLLGRTLHSTEPGGGKAPLFPIDSFFRSLAASEKEKAICVILSGTGTDGTLGLRAVKEEGGVVIVQDANQAKFDGMPRSAVGTGLVDMVLPVEKMAEKILSYVERPHIMVTEKSERVHKTVKNFLERILLLIRDRTRVDFADYKQSSIRRRIERRMAIHQIDSIEDYFRYLEENPSEAEALHKDFLIGVTRFFRDPESFEALSERVLSELIQKNRQNSTLRIWVPGCSTGEEAISIATLLFDCMEKLNVHHSVQIFGTDLDPSAIDRARLGEYPESIVSDVSEERLERFFVKSQNAYRIKKFIRDMIGYAVQNVAQGTPFSKMDLISCRNVLIYMGMKLQRKILPIFHHSLNEGGYLFLGSSESIGRFDDLFSTIETHCKIYQRKDIGSKPWAGNFPQTEEAYDPIPPTQGRQDPKKENLGHLSARAIVDLFAPPYVIVDEKNEVLFSHGTVEKYLKLPEGESSLNIFKMAKESLRLKLELALYEAAREGKPLRVADLVLSEKGEYQIFDLAVNPLSQPKGLSVVAFIEKAASKKLKKKRQAASVEDIDPHIARLERELQATREHLQATGEEIEASNEELKSANEELQSTNEELNTLNSELQKSLDLVTELSNDLNNLLSSTEIATIFLDNRLHIRRFTPFATKILNLIEADIGRSIGDITSKITGLDLRKTASAVLDTLHRESHEILDDDGNWFSVRVLPYRTIDNVIDGIVINIIDITEAKRIQMFAEDAGAYAESIVETVREPLLVLDGDFRVVSANKAFYETFRISRQESEGSPVYELGSGRWNIPALRELLEKIIPEKSSFHDFRVEHDFPLVGHRVLVLNARRIEQRGSRPHLILLAMEDITE
ncbi:MAG: CheR family methyltransferase [Syntrophobacteraceae bacterium]|jgi:two-component system CheB/CheR fusion protein